MQQNESFARKCRSGTADKKTVHCTQQSSDEGDLVSLTLAQEGVNSGSTRVSETGICMDESGWKKHQIDTRATCIIVQKEDVPPGTKLSVQSSNVHV